VTLADKTHVPGHEGIITVTVLWQKHAVSLLLVIANCNPRIPGSRPFSPIPNAEINSVPVPGLRDCKNSQNVVYCSTWLLDDKITILNHLMKYFMHARVLAVHCKFYFDSHSHSLWLRYTYQ